MSLVIMSETELSRLDSVRKIQEKRLSVTRAAKLHGVSRRQVHRWLLRYAADGAAGLVSRRRGKPSNHKYPSDYQQQIVELVREHYPDFGPTLACEKLLERHQLVVGKETLRQWMITAGLWTTRRQHNKRVHQPRNRRECVGELIQIDGSPHWWFEDRGPKCTLLVFIDDATSRLMHLQFAKSESTFDYMRAMRHYIDQHGKPLALYSDKHSVFRVNTKGALGGDNMTQFGRALKELNIEILCANTCQAKGRVERANLTLQDRLVKELRLEGIDDMVTANDYLPRFVEDFNRRFAKPAANDKDLHRPTADHEDPEYILVVKEQRTVSNSLTIQYDRVRFLLEPNDDTAGLKRKKIVVCDFPDGRIEIRHQGKSLPYRIFDKVRHVKQAAIVDNKRLGAVLTEIKKRQHITSHQRSKRAISRQGQVSSHFD